MQELIFKVNYFFTGELYSHLSLMLFTDIYKMSKIQGYLYTMNSLQQTYHNRQQNFFLLFSDFNCMFVVKR